MLEVKTNLNNNDLKNAIRSIVSTMTAIEVIQVQVNLIKEES